MFLKSVMIMLVATSGLVAAGVATAQSQDDELEVMYLVTRYHVENVRELLTDELIKGHEKHIEDYSVSVTSANILDENGKVIGVSSIKGFDSLEDVNYYVYEDPFTKADFYKEITITPINLYVLNAEFARAPDWYLKNNPGETYKYTPVTAPNSAH